MEKERLFSFLLLGLLASVFFVQFVELASAQANDPISNFFGKVWTSFNAGEGVSDELARILFGFLIAILVYSVAHRIPGLSDENKVFLRVVLSAIVAFLGISYFTKEAIAGLLLSYSALGFALGMILPFLIMVFFSYDIIANTDIKSIFVKRVLIQVLWGSFGLWAVYRVVLTTGEGDLIGWLKPAMYIIIAVCFVVVAFASAIIKGVNRAEAMSAIDSSTNTALKAAAYQKIEADALEVVAGKKVAKGFRP